MKRFSEWSGRTLEPTLIGTLENIVDRVWRYIDEGVTLFILSFLGGDFEKEAKLFRDEVVAAFN